MNLEQKVDMIIGKLLPLVLKKVEGLEEAVSNLEDMHTHLDDRITAVDERLLKLEERHPPKRPRGGSVHRVSPQVIIKARAMTKADVAVLNHTLKTTDSMELTSKMCKVSVPTIKYIVGMTDAQFATFMSERQDGATNVILDEEAYTVLWRKPDEKSADA